MPEISFWEGFAFNVIVNMVDDQRGLIFLIEPRITIFKER